MQTSAEDRRDDECDSDRKLEVEEVNAVDVRGARDRGDHCRFGSGSRYLWKEMRDWSSFGTARCAT